MRAVHPRRQFDARRVQALAISAVSLGALALAMWSFDWTWLVVAVAAGIATTYRLLPTRRPHPPAGRRRP